MKLQHKHKQLIVLGIGVVIALMGLIPMLFHIQIDMQILDQVSFVLMIAGIGILFSDRKKKPGKEEKPVLENEENITEETDTKNS